MRLVLEATYQKGLLVLNQNLGSEQEGKKFKVILLEEEPLEAKKERFFQFVKQHSFILPEDYCFNREELYER
jgi:predicted DNA-binding antitoxin AbrB/MazE fold protein